MVTMPPASPPKYSSNHSDACRVANVAEQPAGGGEVFEAGGDMFCQVKCTFTVAIGHGFGRGDGGSDEFDLWFGVDDRWGDNHELEYSAS
ncbi:hypothetical protein PM082_006441 [Marasmius tenuissimus]|nr:hypothetical protein PM082_006441 [Marasmius tenuissimus]